MDLTSADTTPEQGHLLLRVSSQSAGTDLTQSGTSTVTSSSLSPSPRNVSVTPQRYADGAVSAALHISGSPVAEPSAFSRMTPDARSDMMKTMESVIESVATNDAIAGPDDAVNARERPPFAASPSLHPAVSPASRLISNIADSNAEYLDPPPSSAVEIDRASASYRTPSPKLDAEERNSSAPSPTQSFASAVMPSLASSSREIEAIKFSEKEPSKSEMVPESSMTHLSMIHLEDVPPSSAPCMSPRASSLRAEDLEEVLTAEEMYQVHDESEEMEEEIGSGMEDGSQSSGPVGAFRPDEAHKKGRVGRGVTLNMLLSEGIVTPAEAALTVEYMGQVFHADLLASGEIRCCQTGLTFYSPSAWAVYCKKKNNQAKRSGCGWDSIRFKGKKLLAYKAVWYRKQKAKLTKMLEETSHHAHLISPAISNNTMEPPSRSNSASPATVLRVPDVTALLRGGSKSPPSVSSGFGGSGGAGTLGSGFSGSAYSSGSTSPSASQNPVGKTFTPLGDISYFSLVPDKNYSVQTKIECLSFPAMHMKQPFGVTFASNALLLVDFHAHLSTRDVAGYLGGRWNPTTQELLVQAAFPCHCPRGERKLGAPQEAEVKRKMKMAGLKLVGWYHSHPTSRANPSLDDVRSQFRYQQIMEESMSHDRPMGKSWVTLATRPIVALICSPANESEILEGGEKDSDNQAGLKETKPSEMILFWTMSPPKEFMSKHNQFADVPIPVSLDFRTRRNDRVSGFVVCEMIMLSEYFSDRPDRILYNVDDFVKNLDVKNNTKDFVPERVEDIKVREPEDDDKDVISKCIDVKKVDAETPLSPSLLPCKNSDRDEISKLPSLSGPSSPQPQLRDANFPFPTEGASPASVRPQTPKSDDVRASRPFSRLTASLSRFFALGTDGSKFVDSILKKIVDGERVTPEELDETNVVELKGEEDDDEIVKRNEESPSNNKLKTEREADVAEESAFDAQLGRRSVLKVEQDVQTDCTAFSLSQAVCREAGHLAASSTDMSPTLSGSFAPIDRDASLQSSSEGASLYGSDGLRPAMSMLSSVASQSSQPASVIKTVPHTVGRITPVHLTVLDNDDRSVGDLNFDQKFA